VKFNRDQQAQLISYIQRWWQDSDQALEVSRYVAPRNEGQQALLHCIIRDIASHSGCGADWLKTMLKRDSESIFPHWPKKVELNRHGDQVLMPKSEAQLTKAEESELIERLYALGAEWGITWTK
jgi:hypothetical protein